MEISLAGIARIPDRALINIAHRQYIVYGSSGRREPDDTFSEHSFTRIRKGFECSEVSIGPAREKNSF
jgi:hypothetical protein